MNRREFLEALVLFVPALSACQMEKPHLPEPTQTVDIEGLLAEYRRKEKELEPIIEKFEEGFAAFSETTLRHLATSVTTTQERSILVNPFEIFRINRGNADRNIYTFKRKDLEIRRSTKSAVTAIANPNYYFYDLLPEGVSGAARFSPITRTVEILRHYDPANILDNLIAHHELVHVAQDNQDRRQIPPQAYHSFHTTPGYSGSQVKSIPLYEASAYSAEIYLLNLYTEGDFRTDALKGEGVIDISKYVELLHARPEQDSVLSFLARVAYRYYLAQTPLTGIHQDFLNFIAQGYMSQGHDIYSSTPSGYIPFR